MIRKEVYRNIRLGIFVIVGLIFLILGLYFVGNNRNMFNSTFVVNTTFNDVGGLQSGNNVRYAGINIGTVDEVEIKNDTTIEVRMIVVKKMKNILRKNSIATIGTDGLVGSKLVNIDPGTGDAGLIAEGDFIPSLKSVDTEKMLRTLELTNQNIATISGNLKAVTENITKSRGTLYTLLMDTSMAGAFASTMNNIENFSKDLADISDDFGSMANGVRDGKGTLGMLLTDTATASEIKQTVAQLKQSGQQISEMSSNINRVTQKLESGNGTLSTLINDSSAANNMKQSFTNLKESSEKLNQNLEALKHSFLLRGAFRKMEKEKKKAEGK
jgi:phospholipid/cholesterol/gamma-HCH transport system substrate-binding protein